MKNQKEVRANFWNYLKEFQPKIYKSGKRSKRQNEQVIDVRIAFTDYLENLRRNGTITEKQCYNIITPCKSLTDEDSISEIGLF